MPDASSRFYASAPIQSLFARELNALAPILSGVYGNHGLFLRAHAAAPKQLPAHLVGTMVNMECTQPDRWQGDLVCAPWQLPFANDSFKVLIAQHCFERWGAIDQCIAEVSRVLAPEGVVLISGFNPFGSWRPWLSWQKFRGGPKLHLRSAFAWQQLLAQQEVDTLQVRFPGVLWPRQQDSGAIDAHVAGRLARFGSSWLLLARKRRSTLTPIRLRKSARELALNPRLAPGAQRACA